MSEKQRIGFDGETSAIKLLTSKGYQLLERNHRYKRGEIDAIFFDKQNEQLVFVEVKTRKNNLYGEPEEFVSDNQASSILRVAEHYVIKKDWKGMIRFDIVSINLSSNEIVHHVDAFG